MRDVIHDRFRHDLALLKSASGNVDIPGLLAGWMHDRRWVKEVAGMSLAERDARLVELGRTAFHADAGNYASELRYHTRSLDSYWPVGARATFLEEHCALLFASAFDTLVMDGVRNGEQPLPVELNGAELIDHYASVGRGILLLAINQGHPGPLLFHPALASLDIGVVQHTEGASAATPDALTTDRRVRLLPATVVGARRALALLERGQCVLFANDYVFPGVAVIRSSLFGRPVPISRAIVSLALRTGAAVLPVSVERTAADTDRGYRIHLFPAVPTEPTTMADLLLRTAEAFGLITESLIRRAPAQWRLWNTLADRWRLCDDARP